MATSKSQTKQYAAISKYNCFFLRDKNSTYALKNTENSTIIKGEND